MSQKESYYPPKQGEEKFHCPHCGVYAKQRWSHLSAVGDQYTKKDNYGIVRHSSNINGKTLIVGNLEEKWTISICEHCNAQILWLSDKMIFPKKILVQDPNSDLDQEIKDDYLEAANILNDSPRAAAAILRLSLQKLCKQLGESGENINSDIASLVKKGLNPSIQKSLDALRITGNNAVHPGEINLKEDPEKVVKLFGLLNFIAEKMITEPKEIDEFYKGLPEPLTKAIEDRDSSKTEG